MLNSDTTMKSDSPANLPAEGGAGRNADVERKGRKASKETRRQQLIEATIDSLARRGYSETTMADEYAAHWRAALAKAGADPARQLRSLVAADFDRSICNRRKLAAWCAFWGEAKSRPTYQALCGARDEAYQRVFIDLCAALKEDGGYDFEPVGTALGLSAMLEGLWLRLMMGTEKVTREMAFAAALQFLASVFPKHFRQDA